MHAEIVITGVVQGVGYRFFVVRKAREYGITGNVKNLSDGNVIVIAEGEKGLLNDFIEQLKIGPESAHITDVHITWSDNDTGFANFSIET